MPYAPKAGCLVPRCPNRASYRGRCDREIKRGRRRQANHSELHGSKRWQREREALLAKRENWLCKYCLDEGVQTRAECVDHEQAAKGDAGIFWDRSRWIPSCLKHNTRKAIESEGAFGRKAGGDRKSWG